MEEMSEAMAAFMEAAAEHLPPASPGAEYVTGEDGEVLVSDMPVRVDIAGRNVAEQHLGAELHGRELFVPEMEKEETDSNKATWGKPLVRVRVPDGTNPQTFRDVVANVYQMYVLGDAIDSASVATRMGMSKSGIDKIVSSLEFKHAMNVRGVDITGLSGLTAEQEFCLQIMLDPHDGLSTQRKLKKAGVTPTKYQAWLKHKPFADQMNRTSEMLMERNHEAMVQLAGKAASGDLAAIKFMWEVNNKHNPARQQTIDVMAIMSRVMELIYENVKDPATLEAMATGMTILAGEVTGTRNVIEG